MLIYDKLMPKRERSNSMDNNLNKKSKTVNIVECSNILNNIVKNMVSIDDKISKKFPIKIDFLFL